MKNIQEHLKKVEDDQALNGIETLNDTQRNELSRHWAVSQLMQPNIPTGWYNPTTGRYVLGYPGYFVPNSSWTTTAVAALTLTCAAGHRYKVYYAGCRNATQATDAVLSGVIGGNAWTDFNEKAGSAPVAQDTIVLIGQGNQGYDGVAVTGHKAVPYVWLNAGDTLTMTITTFAAGNNTEHLFLFEDYPVE